VKLIVGLGNPGPKYETTRHNAGFLVLDELAERFNLPWEGTQFSAEISRGDVLGEKCLLIKPQTFMNRSGLSVGAAMRFFKIPAGDVVVLHDDLDVPKGTVRARVGGGHGGHNGIRSMITETGVADFHRIKLGIGKSDNPAMEVTDWVLGRFSDEELKTLSEDMVPAALSRLKGIFDQAKVKA